MKTFIKFLAAFITMLFLVVLFFKGVELNTRGNFWNMFFSGLLMAPTMLIVFYWILNKLITPED